MQIMPEYTPELEDNIREAIETFADGPLRESSIQMLSTLGYQSDRTLPDIDNIEDFLDLGEGKLSERQAELLREHWSRVKFVFQVTADELRGQNSPSFATEFARGRIKSFLFLAVDLKQRGYPRGRLAEMTRIVNRIFEMPVILLYRYDKARGGKVITITVIHRRPHKKEQNKDVLEKVTLIKDIKVNNPHRAHLKILSDLSLQRLPDIRDFDDLHKRWETVLNTKPLNHRFYQELFEWFQRAVSEGNWPPGADIEQQVIRCVTRMLFVWFIREKGLIAEDWFDQKKMEKLLHKFGGSDYYQAVLQNLFFATLNVPIEQRAWNKAGKSDLSSLSHWRYKNLIRRIGHFENLMAQTPFINGGLFDCLDYEKSEGGDGKRLDMFGYEDSIDGISTGQNRSDGHLNVPDALFFDGEGLFPLLNRYKFTVEENTPTEIEVALDPELLGQVFENLLAAYNPETRNTARKETGSYYTPRKVVNYMVDEALIAALSAKVQHANLASWQKRLRCLFDYENTEEPFEEEEKKDIVYAISNLKILDPAVGSGAFPMAILHKLTFALRHLDPDNSLWKELQKDAAIKRSEKAYKATNQSQREHELLEISEIFQRYSGDFGRKLYLIQNSIYGVDIQAIACQIAKLRFFISLTIEQEPNQERSNFGIKPLPNLETRFVAADTLLPFKREGTFNSDRVLELQRNLLENRERYFHANERREKLQSIQTDRKLRSELAEELKILNFPPNAADQLTCWNPYDHNDVASWFDPEYMFGVQRFDVVVGNPPYIQLQKDKGKLANRYKGLNYFTYERTGDIYQLFFERGCQFLRREGALAYITSNSWLKAKYGRSLREYLTIHFNPLYLIDMGKDVFDADVDTSILILQKSKIEHPSKAFQGVDIDRVLATDFPPPKKQWGEIRPNRGEIWRILTDLEWDILEKMRDKGKPLKDWKDTSIYMGIKTGYNEAFLIDRPTRERLIAEDARSEEILKPVLRGRDIQRYRANWAERWLITTHNGYGDIPPVDINMYPAIKEHLDQFHERISKRQDKGHTPYNLRNCAYHRHFLMPKLIWIELSTRGRFAYDDKDIFAEATAFIMTGASVKYQCAILNSNLIQWFLGNTAATSGMGVLRWKKQYLSQIPIPSVPSNESLSIVQLVDQILWSKDNDPNADTSETESKIDHLVYELYGLRTAEKEMIMSLNEEETL